MPKVLILQGPNLNLLGEREPEIYGRQSLEELHTELQTFAQSLELELECVQSNHEGVLIDEIHRARNKNLGIILNAGGYTHTSIAIRDAIAAISIPVVEVHLSDIAQREDFRKTNYLRDVCAKSFMGDGIESYKKALKFLKEHV